MKSCVTSRLAWGPSLGSLRVGLFLLSVAILPCASAAEAVAAAASAPPADPSSVSAIPATAAEGTAKMAPPIGVVSDDYRIAPRDLIQFQVFDEPDLLSVQRVSASGEIGVPMLGTVSVGGMTLREAEKILARAYIDGGYFIKPQVILSVQNYAPRSVSVLGQVNRPEQIDFPVERQQIGIVQAITLAGGFTRVAKTDAVRVLRTVDGKEEQQTVNVAAYLDSNAQSEFKLQPGDIVYVPERAF